MDYFSILDLQREPFSNSPEPDLFFLSAQHQRCLQRMELAIRLRRGLNVVVGEVGTGKTTLCRELIVRLAPPQDEHERDGDQQIQTHLILDPAFKSPAEFLLTVSGMFGLVEKEGDQSEWQMKEHIKNYLFRRGVDEGGIVVLIIDEGQKLPLFGVEMLREFLNYETNERKLLQIVIFAQEEFRHILNRCANFADRVNELYHLGPLSFKETRKMIRFRLAKSSRDGVPPSLFTLSGLWAIHRATGGYPRKIITVCHQAILTLIIRNQTKVGRSVVMACVRRVAPERKKAPLRRWLAGAAVVMLGVVALPLVFQQNALPVLPVIEKNIMQQAENNRVMAPPPVAAPVTVAVQADLFGEKQDPLAFIKASGAPDSLGSLQVKKGETVSRIIRNVYGVVSRDQHQAIAKANPHIEDFNQVREAETIVLPVLSLTAQLPASKHYWVRIAEAKDIEEAYALLKGYPKHLPPVRLLPYWNPKEGLMFVLVLHNGFEDKASDKASAIEMAMSLPPALALKARIITGQQETVFLKKIIE
ncbi:MAG: hypothetical protein C0394_00650 [Syntrophus sp. (in: bacteria)]|nr:hypothetical protein [Syntrophus sp. (in: bacteria)]